MDPIDAGLRALVPPGTDDPAGWLAALAEAASVGKSGTSPVGAVAIDEGRLDDARRALVDWAAGAPADDPARVALARGYVFWLLRPALRLTATVAGVRAADPAEPAWGRHTDALQRVVAQWSPSVARIDLERKDGTRAVAGTGWVVGETADAWVLLTARHVVNDLAAAGWRDGGLRALADFAALDGPGAAFPLRAAAKPHAALDLATIELPKAGAPACAPFPLAPAAAQPGDPVLVLGHGIFRPQGFAVDVVGFDRASGVKRASPGYLGAPGTPGLPALRADWAGAVPHDATTLGGNSGGPVVDLRTGAVVGAHVGGAPAVPGVDAWYLANFALPTVATAVDALLAGVATPARGPLWT